MTLLLSGYLLALLAIRFWPERKPASPEARQRPVPVVGWDDLLTHYANRLLVTSRTPAEAHDDAPHDGSRKMDFEMIEVSEMDLLRDSDTRGVAHDATLAAQSRLRARILGTGPFRVALEPFRMTIHEGRLVYMGAIIAEPKREAATVLRLRA